MPSILSVEFVGSRHLQFSSQYPPHTSRFQTTLTPLGKKRSDRVSRQISWADQKGELSYWEWFSDCAKPKRNKSVCVCVCVSRCVEVYMYACVCYIRIDIHVLWWPDEHLVLWFIDNYRGEHKTTKQLFIIVYSESWIANFEQSRHTCRLHST